MRLLLCHVFTASLLVLVCAQEASALECDTASACYDQGIAKYIEEEYGLAIVAFQRAYAMTPEGVHLANIAACYGQLSKYDKATEFAERADAQGDLLPAEHAHNTARLAAFRMHLSGQRALESSPPPQRFETASATPANGIQMAQTYTPSRNRQVTRGLLLGVGGVSILTSAVLSTGWFADVDNSGNILGTRRNRRQQVGSLTMLSLGTAALATGTVLVIIDRRRRKKGMSVAPVLAPGLAGAQVGFTF